MTKKKLKLRLAALEEDLQTTRDKRDHWYQLYVNICGERITTKQLVQATTEARILLTRALVPFNTERPSFGDRD